MGGIVRASLHKAEPAKRSHYGLRYLQVLVAVAQYAQAAHETTIKGFLLAIIPDTLLGAFTSGSILQILLVSVLFGSALALVGDRGKPLLDLLETASQVMFKLVAIVMRFAPI